MYPKIISEIRFEDGELLNLLIDDAVIVSLGDKDGGHEEQEETEGDTGEVLE